MGYAEEATRVGCEMAGATEILYAINGTLTSGTIGENGSRFVFSTINPGQATIFPKGSADY